MDRSTLKDLFHHMEWADALMWKAVFATPDTQTNDKLREVLFHIHNVQQAFLQTWRGEPRVKQDPGFGDLREMVQWGRLFYPAASEFLGTLTDDDLARPLLVPWSRMVEERTGRPAGITTLGETMMQAVLHGMNHRGQANTRIRELGGESSIADYIAWLWFGRPAPEWPEGG